MKEKVSVTVAAKEGSLIRNLFCANFLCLRGKFRLIFRMTLILLCLNVTVEAVPDFKTEFAVEWPSVGTRDMGGVFVMNDFLPYPYSYRNNSGLSDVRYAEWTAVQDFRYNYLEKVLYNYLGGTYEPCSIGFPFRPEHRRYIIIRVKDSINEKCADVTENLGDASNSGDIYAGLIFSSCFLKSSSMGFIEPETISLNVSVVPEPSSIVLFAAAAFGFLLMGIKRNLQSLFMR